MGLGRDFDLFRTALPVLWELATSRELKHRAGSIQKGLLQAVCALNPAGYQDFSALLGEARNSHFEDH